MKPAAALQHLQQMAANMEAMRSKAVFVGLPAEAVGGAIYGDGMTVLRIGAIHEYGASFTHPGGTPYVIGEGGRARFVPKGTAGTAGTTKPHNITIPQRSFLRTPFATKRREINEQIAAQFERASNGVDVDQCLGRIGVVAANISKGAFVSQGYGDWLPILEETKRAKGSGQTLIDTGTLRNSITWVIR